MKLSEEIEDFVEHHLFVESATYPKQYLLEDYETEILYTPLLCRLKKIHQMGFAHLVYIGADHSRLEHSLGVLKLCTRLTNSIKKEKPRLIDDIGVREIRLAALMHDTGHGIFSHSSEGYFKEYPELREIYQDSVEIRNSAPHEVISSLIVQSNAFKGFFENLEAKYDIFLNLREVSNCIIGISEKDNAFKSEIMNGPLDVDKIDYILRDMYWTGIHGEYRLLDMLRHVIVSWVGKKRVLAIKEEGINSILELLNSKYTIYRRVHSHHTVRSFEYAFRGLLDYCREAGIHIRDRTLHKVVDFLWLSEDDLLYRLKEVKDPKLRKLAEHLDMGGSLKMALELSDNTTSDPYSLKQIFELDSEEKRALTKKIWQEAGRPCFFEEIWMDTQSFPPLDPYFDFSVISSDLKAVLPKDIVQLLSTPKELLKKEQVIRLFCPIDCIGKVRLASKRTFSEVGIDIEKIEVRRVWSALEREKKS